MEPVMVTEKKAFVGKPKGPPEERQAIALEFIAHYLDRIDSHLERLAAAVETGGENGKTLRDIAKALKK
jgi:hypothetical protein